jgi:hypothetical protein
MNPALLAILRNKYVWIGLAAAVLLIVILPKIWKKKDIPGKNTPEGKDQSASSVTADDELKRLAKKGVLPTLTPTDLRMKAEALHAALDGCGTDDTAILRIFGSMKTEADVYALINAYGVRKVTCLGVGSSSGLAAHLQECSDETKAILNRAATSKGWTFRI